MEREGMTEMAANSEQQQLKELVAQTLQTKGVLGKLLAELICEFLQFYQLDYTLSVFSPEAVMPTDTLPDRPQLASRLGIKPGGDRDRRPLLHHVLQQFQDRQSSPVNQYPSSLPPTPPTPQTPQQRGSHDGHPAWQTRSGDDPLVTSLDQSVNSSMMLETYDHIETAEAADL
eukprot:gnl/Hemi2/26664_TR8952_c0_g1_i1.p1 gnl/Hemi2/26664_TR8952_c0_g1~~gnl/Hemi2/26664_TR8952_c0_g1_i1.p1  ORF type:complete len:173 (+),score=66.74 gnl/Hemi2/26664_TR8952_c0_g1_i1:123-641(+)